MTPIKYNNNNFLLSYQLQYMLDIRKVVEDGKDWKGQQRLWKDYPCVASVCSRNFRIGKGYSKNCAKVLKAKRPKQLNQQVANRITNYISSITVKNGKDEYGRKIYNGSVSSVWHPSSIIKGVPWDIPVVGYRGSSVAILRLWESRSTEQFNWDVFNAGGYVDAQAEKSLAETISKVLYPNDSTQAGKELRLTQQYFFCACSLRDILRRYNRTHHHDYSDFANKIAIQLNDTHPTIAIPELMRLLIDEEGLSFDAAWDITSKSFNYTNHTLLPEALEKWPVYIFEKLLPRHLEIIYEINYRFLNDVVEKKWPGNNDMKAKLSIIEEGQCRMVRMANLCVITSGKVNGVAKIHSKLVKEDLFPACRRCLHHAVSERK